MVVTDKMVDELIALYKRWGRTRDYRMMCREVLKKHGATIENIGKAQSNLIKAHSKRKKENARKWADRMGHSL